MRAKGFGFRTATLILQRKDRRNIDTRANLCCVYLGVSDGQNDTANGERSSLTTATATNSSDLPATGY